MVYVVYVMSVMYVMYVLYVRLRTGGACAAQDSGTVCACAAGLCALEPQGFAPRRQCALAQSRVGRGPAKPSSMLPTGRGLGTECDWLKGLRECQRSADTTTRIHFFACPLRHDAGP